MQREIQLRTGNGREQIEVRELENGTFELLGFSCLLVPRAGYGDLVELRQAEDGAYDFVRVARRLFRHRWWTIPGEFGSSQALQKFGDWIAAHGGHWECLASGLLLIDLPRGAPEPDVASELAAHVEAFLKSDEHAEIAQVGPFWWAKAAIRGREGPSQENKDQR